MSKMFVGLIFFILFGVNADEQVTEFQTSADVIERGDIKHSDESITDTEDVTNTFISRSFPETLSNEALNDEPSISKQQEFVSEETTPSILRSETLKDINEADIENERQATPNPEDISHWRNIDRSDENESLERAQESSEELMDTELGSSMAKEGRMAPATIEREPFDGPISHPAYLDPVENHRLLDLPMRNMNGMLSSRLHSSLAPRRFVHNRLLFPRQLASPLFEQMTPQGWISTRSAPIPDHLGRAQTSSQTNSESKLIEDYHDNISSNAYKFASRSGMKANPSTSLMRSKIFQKLVQASNSQKNSRNFDNNVYADSQLNPRLYDDPRLS